MLEPVMQMDRNPTNVFCLLKSTLSLSIAAGWNAMLSVVNTNGIAINFVELQSLIK